MQKFDASPELMKFFENLIEIKNLIKEKLESSNDDFLRMIMEKFDATLKVSDE